MVDDNNLSACRTDHIREVFEYCTANKLKILLDNGLDCKCITQEIAELLGKTKFYTQGLRMAFDRIEEDGVFQDAVQLLRDNGVCKSHLMAYTLYNFKDTPEEANYRMTECVRIGIRPYPQRYRPLNHLDRKTVYVGKHWNKPLLKSFNLFWQMAGYYTKYDFLDWCRTKAPDTHKLTDSDLACWKGI